jgi:hypothetical protein
MFKDNPNIVSPAEGIYWYKNFLSKDEVDKINNILQNKEHEYNKNYFDHFEFVWTSFIPELHPIWEKMSELLYPEYLIHPMLSVMKFETGTKMVPHCDSPGEDHADELTIPDLWGTCHILSWGVCVYFGDFTGGEVYYPNQDVVVPVQPGDLVIHNALPSHLHGVHEVKSGTRYTYSNFSMKKEKAPGSFYNYKTDEYYEATRDLESWMKPLFKNPMMDDIKNRTEVGRTTLGID